MNQQNSEQLTIGLAQIAPVWLDREKTLAKVLARIEEAADKNCSLVAFGEALVPGYPFWLELTDGARFNSPIQKEIHAEYVNQAVSIERGDLKTVCELAAARKIAVYLGCIERPSARGGHSLYCSLVYIAPDGEIGSVHRKLMPTYEERLAWSIGDGNGLRVHALGAFTVGGLNCWENWMPLARTALYAQGEDLHIAIYPGGIHNTEDITRFTAKEGRSFVASICGLLRNSDVPTNVPHYDLIAANMPEISYNGGSCLAAPNGEWIIEPVVNEEVLLVGTIDYRRVLEERQNFDPVGHYSRPDVLQLTVNRQRQIAITFKD